VVAFDPVASEALREGADGALPEACARTALEELTILVAGSSEVAHYEAAEPDVVADLLAIPSAARIVPASDAGALYDEIFTWETSNERGTVERAALLLTLQPGKEQAYRDWLESGVLSTLETIWMRNNIWRHDVLARGTSLIAYYECESRFNVLKAFREPEALMMLTADLSGLMILDPYVPFALHEEKFFWSAPHA
jgi:hypothetical protein